MYFAREFKPLLFEDLRGVLAGSEVLGLLAR
jgi:hypothetical protein